MNRQLTNSAYGILDYASYPAAMLLVAPVVLHRLGASEYGLWITSTAVISAGGIIASGFSDSNIQKIAEHRGTGNHDLIGRTAGSMLGINIVLGALIAIFVWFAAPVAARHMAASKPFSAPEYLFCLRAASIGIFLRAIESVAVSTHRAFEEYRHTVKISTVCRLVTLGIAAILAYFGQRMAAILSETVLVLAIGVYLQFHSLRHLMRLSDLYPRVHADTKRLLSLGVFPWLQALGSILFGQLDRILLSVYMGTVAVTPYALCVQFAQPITGVSASGLSFLFPYLSKRASTITTTELKLRLARAFMCNLIVAVCGTVGMLSIGRYVIQLWAGPAVAQSATGLLLPVTMGSALASLGATATYAMQAMGKFRTVALIALGGRCGLFFLMALLMRRFGIEGLAYSRLCYGVIPLAVYIPLLRAIHAKEAAKEQSDLTLSTPCQEVSTT